MECDRNLQFQGHIPLLGIKGKEESIVNNLLGGIRIGLHVTGIVAEINPAFLHGVGDHIGPQILHAHAFFQEHMDQLFLQEDKHKPLLLQRLEL